MADAWRVTVSGLAGAVYLQDSSIALSYARPSISSFDGPGAASASSRGNQLVRILGAQFGTIEDDAVSSVTYGPGDKYVAADCHVVISHQEIHCNTVPGVGSQLRWSVSIGNLSSQTPTTGYAAPVIYNITGDGADDATTAGGQVVFVEGDNFGTIKESLVDYVTYFSDNNPSLVLSAVNCSVVTDHVTVQCLTSPGIGYDLKWQISIGGQASERSSVITSYGPPVVDSATLLTAAVNSTTLLDTEGGTLLSIKGSNFGRAGDAFVYFAGQRSSSTVYVNHNELQVWRSVSWMLASCISCIVSECYCIVLSLTELNAVHCVELSPFHDWSSRCCGV